MNKTNSISQIIDSFETKYGGQDIFAQASQIYSLQAFKIKKLCTLQTRKSYDQIKQKYESQQIEPWISNWHKNERKNFSEVLIFYCHTNKTTPLDMTQEEWNCFSHIFFGKEPNFLKFQGLSLMKNVSPVKWAPNDDILIQQAIRQLGKGNWNEISKKIFFSTQCTKFITAKQIRERWYNHISTEIKRGQWQLTQDLAILQHVYQKNSSWSEIMKCMNHTRTEHMIKNRYKYLINKEKLRKGSGESVALQKALLKTKRKMSLPGEKKIGDLRKIRNFSKNQRRVEKKERELEEMIAQKIDKNLKVEQQEKERQVQERQNAVLIKQQEPQPNQGRESQFTANYFWTPMQVHVPYSQYPYSSSFSLPIQTQQLNYGFGTLMSPFFIPYTDMRGITVQSFSSTLPNQRPVSRSQISLPNEQINPQSDAK